MTGFPRFPLRGPFFSMSMPVGRVVPRMLAAWMVVMPFLFLLDNTLIFWFDWPGTRHFLVHLGVFGETRSFPPLNGSELLLGWVQGIVSLSVCLVISGAVVYGHGRGLKQDAMLYSRMAAFITRAAFWGIFLVGIIDMLISFLRIEGMLSVFVGEHLTTQLGRSIFRGTYVHFPLILISIIIAAFTRTLGFIWLALLIVVAEFLIVLTRFVFSYEQAFMGDLVRFWYAGLFLFASAFTLLHDGHVRVDVFYTNFSKKGKALTNTIGSLLLGLPLCWCILVYGMSGKGSIINSPLLSFEISQSGFGMYIKYLMAAYLLVFAVSMATQFVGFILSNLADFREGGWGHETVNLET